MFVEIVMVSACVAAIGSLRNSSKRRAQLAQRQMFQEARNEQLRYQNARRQLHNGIVQAAKEVRQQTLGR